MAKRTSRGIFAVELSPGQSGWTLFFPRRNTLLGHALPIGTQDQRIGYVILLAGESRRLRPDLPGGRQGFARICRDRVDMEGRALLSVRAHKFLLHCYLRAHVADMLCTLMNGSRIGEALCRAILITSTRLFPVSSSLHKILSVLCRQTRRFPSPSPSFSIFSASSPALLSCNCDARANLIREKASQAREHGRF